MDMTSAPRLSSAPSTAPARTRLLDAALQVIRTKGYTATTVDDICAAAGVTKGSFFHHFKGKEDLGITAAHHWGEVTGAMFAAADYHAPADPRERVLGYLALRTALLEGELPDVTCLLGTMVQETYATHPAIRDACQAVIHAHADTVAEDLAAAKARHAPQAAWDPQEVSLYFQAVLQGAFVLAKAEGSAGVARRCVAHLRAYVETVLLPTAAAPPASAD